MYVNRQLLPETVLLLDIELHKFRGFLRICKTILEIQFFVLFILKIYFVLLYMG